MKTEKKFRWTPGGIPLPGLREVRESQAVSINKLCRDVKCDPAHISRAERGMQNVGVPLATAIAEYLGVSLERIKGSARVDLS